MREFGWKRSPKDDRDWPLAKFGVGASSSIPDSIDRSSLIEDIYTQDGPSCTGWGATRGWFTRARIQGDSAAKYPNAPAVYALARAREVGPGWADPLPDDGAYVRFALDAMNECGVLALDGWVPPDRRTRPNWRALQDSSDRRGVRYALCASPNEIKLALAAGHPVVVGWDWDTSLRDFTGGVWTGPVGESVGGHATCLIDYDARGPRGVNSWGREYGEDGCYRVSWQATAGIEAYAVELVTT